MVGVVFTLSFFTLANSVEAQFSEVNRVVESTQVLSEIQNIALQGIPQGMLQNAQAIAVIPNVIKVGFAVAGRHGKGIVIVRNADGTWSNPIFVSLTGGGIGWQVGVQSTDVILVFKSRESVEKMMNGRFTVGVDAAVAAGPVGRQAAAATDAQLKSEILSYSRSRGLFAGASLDGAAISVDNNANTLFYGGGTTVANIVQNGPAVHAAEVGRLHAAAGGKGAVPTQVAGNSQPGFPNGVLPTPIPALAKPASLESVRTDLAGKSHSLLAMVDQEWRNYLSLPIEIYSPTAVLKPLAIQEAINRYDKIYFEPQYQVIRNLPEFQRTYESLRHLNYLVRTKQPENMPSTGVQN